ncbi:MAG TPA: regulatory protein RecX [Candidatus Angelobacter sp.]|nr:regulatory protein RecX [Candidatus Angelobacter sp.]
MAFKRPAIIDNENALYDYALGALGRRMRSVAELKRLMRARVTDDEHGELLMATVIARLKENKYLNDSSYAAAFSGFRRDNEKFGRRRVITDLKAKGVHGDVIEKAVNEAFRSVSETEQARAFLRRKRLKKPENDRETARIFRALMRAGFSTATSIKLLKEWNVDDETLTALEEESSESRS